MTLPKEPFGELALCLSGGGYRAASFHLGSMSYLNRLNYRGEPLLIKVKALSTVSGGTITGVFYALKTNQGATFDQIYKELIDFLQNHDLVQESLKKLNADGHWNNTTKSKNLINAFAEIYDEALLKGATFNDLTSSNNSHIIFSCFNSTEFTTGINFRFQYEWKGNRQNKMIKRGNGNFTFSFDALQEIKLSDVIAASSCFPGGFEPLNFPNDFINEASTSLKSLLGSKHYLHGIGLMDGGIYDNQGIDAIQLIEKRRLKQNQTSGIVGDGGRRPYDLLIISDVGSPYISNPFKFHNTRDRSISHYNIRKIDALATSISKASLLIPALMIITGMVMGFLSSWDNSFITGIGVMMVLTGIVIAISRWFIMSKLRSWSKDLYDLFKSMVGEYFFEKFSVLKVRDYTVRQMEPLVFDRLNSLSLMIQEVFLKQVRRLKYKSIYEDRIYDNRRISNLIKELTREDWDKVREYQKLRKVDVILQGSYLKVIGRRIGKLADEASSFGTTLWFTDQDKVEEKLNKLIALGQITMCFNLMVHITRLKNDAEYKLYSISTKRSITRLFNECKSDWEKFRKNPEFILKDYDSI